MTGKELLDALHPWSGGLRVVSRSGKLYDIERCVIEVNAEKDDPYLYGFPVKRHPRDKTGVRWFYARNVRLAEHDDQVNI